MMLGAYSFSVFPTCVRGYVHTNMSVCTNVCHCTVDTFLVLYFSYFSMNTYVVGIHYKHLDEVLLLSTNKIFFVAKYEK